jgi:hypothetical protein
MVQLYGPVVKPNRRYYPDKLVALNLKPDAGTHEVAVSLRRGVTVKARVIGPDGKPVAHGSLVCRWYVPYGYDHASPAALPVEDGYCEVPGCDPVNAEPVFIVDTINQAGAVVRLSGKAEGTTTIELQRCGSATARFLDGNGKPLANMRPRLEMVVTPGVSFFDYDEKDQMDPLNADDISMGSLDGRYETLRTDAQGKVTFPTLLPGATFRIIAQSPEAGFVNVKKDFTVEPGQLLDLKDITIKPRR